MTVTCSASGLEQHALEQSRSTILVNDFAVQPGMHREQLAVKKATDAQKKAERDAKAAEKEHAKKTKG